MKDTAWGTEEREYGYLKPYLQELARLNPGSNFFHEQDSSGHFLRCGFTVPFLADLLTYGVPAQMHGMAHLRDQKPYGCPGWQPQYFGGKLGLHQSENEQEWCALMDSNRKVLNAEGFPVDTIFLLGDADKGMKNASNVNFPECRSFRCVKHHSKNLASAHRASQEIRYFYTCAAMAYMPEEYDHHMNLILQTRPDVHEAIVRADPTNFARTKVGCCRFDLITQSDAESINSKYVKERSLARFDVLQQIELAVMKTIQERKHQAESRLSTVTLATMQFSGTPWAQGKITESLKYAKTGCDVVAGHAPGTFAVYAQSDRRTRWLVNLNARICSCGRFQEIQIPCVHCLAVLSHVPDVPYTAWSLCHAVYKTENWAKCYARTLNPVDISKLKPMEGCKPPLYRTQRGRPKGTKRILGADEVMDRTSRMCRNCNQMAHHNSATCRNAPRGQMDIIPEAIVEI